MSANRQQVMTTLAVFKNPVLMKKRYGIKITDAQIAQAEKAIKNAAEANETTINAIIASGIKWPYTLNEEQKYDRLMMNVRLTMTQSVLWQNIKQWLIAHPDERKTDKDAILNALQDMEELLQMNVYMGQFEENTSIINGNDIEYTMRLFTLSYKKYTALNADNGRKPATSNP